ncbi:hypothetical protein ACTGXY_09980, partial [Streptococcus suis]
KRRDLGTVNGTMGCDIKKSSSFFITVYWRRERVDRYFVIGRLRRRFSRWYQKRYQKQKPTKKSTLQETCKMLVSVAVKRYINILRISLLKTKNSHPLQIPLYQHLRK